jgi:hypothetical protein
LEFSKVKVGSEPISYDFVLVIGQAAVELRRQKAEEAMVGSSRKFKSIDNSPVPDVD